MPIRRWRISTSAKWKKEARDESSAAYILGPESPQSLRAVATLLSRLGDPAALDFWRRLSMKTGLTRTDLREKAAIALKVRDEDQARQTIDELARKDSQPADWILTAQLAIQEKNFDQGYIELNKVFASNKASNAEQLQAVTLLEKISKFRNGTLEPVVLRRLGELAHGKDGVALEALTLLAYRHLDAKNAPAAAGDLSDPELIALLRDHPLAQTTHQLTAISLLMHANPEKRDTILVREQLKNTKHGITPP